jgi:hypothetical protein
MKGEGLSSYSRQQKSNWPNHSVQFKLKKRHKLGMLNHTEMHSDNKMRKRGSEGGLEGWSRGWRGGRKGKGRWEGEKMNQQDWRSQGSGGGVVGGTGSEENQRTNQETQFCSSFGESAKLQMSSH